MDTAINPARVEKKVVSNNGKNTSAGFAAPAAALKAIMLIGIIVKAEVLSTRNIICALEAVFFFGLIS